MSDDAILGRQVELLYRNIPLGQATSVVNGTFLVWLWHASTGLAASLAWLAAVVAVAGGRLALGLAYRQRRESALSQPDPWRRYAIAGAAIAGLVWSGGALLYMASGDTIQLLFTAFVMAGMVAGAVPLLAADRTAFRVYAWPVVIAGLVAGLGNDALHVAFVAMAALYLVIATRSAGYFHETLCETLRLEHEKGRLLEDLARAKVEAEASDRAKSRFLATISHELLTPMNGIMGMAELLSMESLTAEQRELLAPLRASADELLQKIDSMILLSSLEDGSYTPQATHFSLTEALAPLIHDQGDCARRKGLAFAVDLPDSLPAVIMGDRAALKRILAQLVDNAIKFTSTGQVTVSVCEAGRQDNRVRLAFAVSDSGPGIPAALREDAFGLFRQGDDSYTRRHGGAGIGLPLSQRLATAAGGTLILENAPGTGTVARLTLPFALPD